MTIRTISVLVAFLAVSVVAWAERKPEPPAPADAPSATASPEEGFTETTPPEIGLKTEEGASKTPAAGSPPAAETPASGPPPMPEWWNKTKANLDKAMDEASGGTQTTPQAGAESNPAPSAKTPVVKTTLRSYAQGFAALCMVVALILLCNYLVTRFGKKTPLLAGASLGTLLGRLFLSPKASLYFVRVKDKVLIVGVTPTSVSAVAEMDASAFETAPVAAPLEAKPGARSSVRRDEKTGPSPAGDKFLSQLKGFMRTNPPGPRAGREDDEIATLRGDIARLRRELQEGTREQDE